MICSVESVEEPAIPNPIVLTVDRRDRGAGTGVSSEKSEKRSSDLAGVLAAS